MNTADPRYTNLVNSIEKRYEELSPLAAVRELMEGKPHRANLKRAYDLALAKAKLWAFTHGWRTGS